MFVGLMVRFVIINEDFRDLGNTGSQTRKMALSNCLPQDPGQVALTNVLTNEPSMVLIERYLILCKEKGRIKVKGV